MIRSQIIMETVFSFSYLVDNFIYLVSYLFEDNKKRKEKKREGGRLLFSIVDATIGDGEDSLRFRQVWRVIDLN